MSFRERLKQFDAIVQSASAHLSVWPWVFAIGAIALTGMGIFWAAISPAIEVFAPYSYFVVAGVTVPLAVGIAWPTLALTRWLLGWPKAPTNGHSDAPQRAAGADVDFSVWDAVQRFQLLQAACLWMDKTPSQRTMASAEGAAIATMFLDAMRDGRLPNDIESMDSERARQTYASLQWFGPIQRSQLGIPIRRDDLRKFAEDTQQRPAFLFPEDRR